MKHTIFFACIGLFVLFTGCGGKKTESSNVGGESRTVVVESIATVQLGTAGDGRPMLLVPSGALFMRGQLEGVQVVGDDDIVSIRWIRAGKAVGDYTEVLSGLGTGEAVVVPYVKGVREGDNVTVKP
ncbi:hypothetical protein [Prosthecochloris sp. SCSIO W1103]|uniref:hypothetical protein n=1 Tax=Prosthecochloris sp. SCSIO W1103 TaxID=2992244 RepID=UPI00223DD5B5|nr:hypothetical protein [Prosthecochloris sp. SCSIO W1103]UZJ37450.1 hypothetical protein OO005_11990 [Prosthecochloris sp. SCSIO W1103]